MAFNSSGAYAPFAARGGVTPFPPVGVRPRREPGDEQPGGQGPLLPARPPFGAGGSGFVAGPHVAAPPVPSRLGPAAPVPGWAPRSPQGESGLRGTYAPLAGPVSAGGMPPTVGGSMPPGQSGSMPPGQAGSVASLGDAYNQALASGNVMLANQLWAQQQALMIQQSANRFRPPRAGAGPNPYYAGLGVV